MNCCASEEKGPSSPSREGGFAIPAAGLCGGGEASVASRECVRRKAGACVDRQGSWRFTPLKMAVPNLECWSGRATRGAHCCSLGSFKRHSLLLAPLIVQVTRLCRRRVASYPFSSSSQRLLIFQGGTFSSNKRYLLREHVSCSCWGFCSHTECFLGGFICLSLLCRLNLPSLLSGGG